MTEVLPRLFVAIPIAEHVRIKLEAECEKLQKKYSFRKWSHPDDYHITLKFLGETAPDQMEHIKAALGEAVHAARPFHLTAQNLGTFGPAEAPSVLWAGIHGEVKPLLQLQRTVDQALDKLSFPCEKRPFHPHLTLARNYIGSRFPDNLTSEFSNTADNPSNTWTADTIVLYHSHLNQRPIYEELAVFPFLGKQI